VTRRLEVLHLLADGREHSGEALAGALGISRAAVWKHVQQLEQWGLTVAAAAGKGYRLGAPVDLLQREALLAAMPAMARERLRRLELLDELDSTNEALLATDDLSPGRFDACVAEFQRHGRGRRGRSWLAPFGAGVCLSVNWRFRDAPAQLSALSLAAGVAVRRALASCDAAEGVGLKWPNDILLGERKLGGVLCELRAEAGGPAYVVVGVGINVRLPEAARDAIGTTGLQPASLDDVAAERLPSRSALAGALAGQLALALAEFAEAGLAPFAAEWRDADRLRDRPVSLLVGEQAWQGVARGIDADGALLLERDGRVERVVSGEISLRPAS